MNELKKLKWHIHRDYTISDLWNRVDFLRIKCGVKVVFIDFLQRIRDERYKGDRVREVENISMELANMSRELDVAVIALAQLSGYAENLEKNEIPDMKYLKESQGIAENADCIIMMHNPKRLESPYVNDEYQQQHFKLKVEQRYGISGQTIEIIGDLRTCIFCDSSGF